jgi:tetratricopeptide (TPR) repeat protein
MQHQYDKALPYLQRAIEEKPTLPQAYRDLGKLYMETNDYDRALIYLKKVIQLDPSVPNTHYLLATTYRHLGNTAEAQAEMEMFQKMEKEQNERRRPSDAILQGQGQMVEPKINSETEPDAH